MERVQVAEWAQLGVRVSVRVRVGVRVGVSSAQRRGVMWSHVVQYREPVRVSSAQRCGCGAFESG